LIGSSQGINVKKVGDHQDAAQAEQAKKCAGVAPKITCLTKSYNWGLVWLHGLGNGQTSHMYQNLLIPQIMAISGMPPGTGLSVFPQAPQQYVQSDGLMEQSWHGQELKTVNVSYKPPHHGFSLDDGLKNVPIVHAGVRQLMELGIPANRIFLAGHSQGGSMVYLSAMKFPERLAGAINLSGGLLGWWQAKDMLHPVQQGLPMMWIKGNADDIVPQEHQDEILPHLMEAGFPVEKAYFNGKHDLTDPTVIGHVSGFINKHLTPQFTR
jgi:predicted esterase